MPGTISVGTIIVLIAALLQLSAATPAPINSHVKRSTPISPKVFIISMFTPEAEVWWGIDDFDVLAQNITVPGFSPLFPDAHCTADGQICQMVTGEGEINAASSVSGLVLSPYFNLTQTYFMIAGIAGISPEIGTTGSVTFARYAIQVALQHELDAREKPANFSTGYWPQNSNSPTQYPTAFYGTEVFEVSDSLRQMAMQFASTAQLNDTGTAQTYRALYAPAAVYAAGAAAPSVYACDVATSDVYFTGDLLASAFANTTKLFTNNTGVYGTSAQEDNATLEALLRGAIHNLTDFARIIVMRTASDFDRPPPGVSPLQHILYNEQGGFDIATQNIYLAGIGIVRGIVAAWNDTFAAGVTPTNYIGDIFNSLGGNPDYGLVNEFIQPPSRLAVGRLRGRSMALRRRYIASPQF